MARRALCTSTSVDAVFEPTILRENKRDFVLIGDRSEYNDTNSSASI